jgi:excisionase family DNA binding protein
VENKYRDLHEVPVTLRVEDLMPLLGIGRKTAYELIRSGQIRSIRVGRQIRIPREALLEFLNGREF